MKPRVELNNIFNMMKLRSFLMMCAVACTLGAQAQTQTQAAAVAGPKDGSETADLLRTAGELVQYGYRTQSALPLVQAVEIYNRLGVTAATDGRQKTEASEGTVTAAATTGKSNPVSYSTKQLLADATKYADGDKSLLALIKNYGGERGRVGGPACVDDLVKAGYTDTWTMTFRGGEKATVVVNGDGDTDLDLYIYDENNNLITSDTDRTDLCICNFTPSWTGKFYIKIKNLGNVYNRYRLTTN